MISPAQAKILTPIEMIRAEREEQRIDAEIAGFDGRKVVYVTDVPPRVRAHLLRRYVDAGWSVVQQTDSREGAIFFDFTIPCPPPSGMGRGFRS